VADVDSRAEPLGFGGLMASMGLFVVIGTPLVYLIWKVVNDILTGHVVTTRLVLAVPALVVLWLVLRLMARSIRRWDSRIG
jgi:hypothetical protein